MHLMIDLETLGTQPGSRVVEIGACFFDAHSVNPETFSVGVDDPHGKVDQATVDWWLQQGDAARYNLSSIKKRPIGEALQNFECWVLSNVPSFGDLDGVWAHGPTFDIALMEALYFRAGVKVPWGYRSPRDTRTLSSAIQMLGGPANALWDDSKGGVDHRAADDALQQARWVSSMMRWLEGVHVS